MLTRVFWDETKNSKGIDQRLRACLEFVSDELIPVTVYVNNDWSKGELLKAIGVDPRNIPAPMIPELRKRDLLPQRDYSGQTPRVAVLRNREYERITDTKSALPVSVIGRHLLVSPSEIVNRGALLDRPFSAETVVLALAASGLDLFLPNLSFDIAREEEFSRIKDTLRFERLEYLNAVTNLVNDTRQALASENADQIFAWARDEAFLKIAPYARERLINVFGCAEIAA